MLEQCPLLIRCRQHVGAFEIFIGKNGRIWIRCGPAVKKGGNHVPSGVLQLKNILEKANRKIKLNLELLDIDECFK